MVIVGREQKQPMLLAAVGAILVVAAFVGWARQSNESPASVSKPSYLSNPNFADDTAEIAPKDHLLDESSDSATDFTSNATATAAGTVDVQKGINKVGIISTEEVR